jgi:hypothetical protein
MISSTLAILARAWIGIVSIRRILSASGVVKYVGRESSSVAANLFWTCSATSHEPTTHSSDQNHFSNGRPKHTAAIHGSEIKKIP